MRSQTVDPEVYNQYLLARRFLAPSSLDGFVRAVRRVGEGHLPRPRIRTRLGHALDGLRRPRGLRGAIPDEIALNQRKAVAAAARAIDLDPRLAEAYAARAQLLAQTSWDWESAREDFDHALALAPGDADILRKKGAWLLAPQGRVTEAIEVLRRSTELDPLSASAWMSLGLLEVAATRGRAGEGSLLRATEIAPDNDYVLQALGVRELLVGNPAGALARTNRCSAGVWRLRGAALAEHDLGHARRGGGGARRAHRRAGQPVPVPDRRGARLARRGRPGLRLAREGAPWPATEGCSSSPGIRCSRRSGATRGWPPCSGG